MGNNNNNNNERKTKKGWKHEQNHENKWAKKKPKV